MLEALKPRKEIPIELTWNLMDLFVNEAAYEAALTELSTLTASFAERYQGRIAQSSAPDFILQAVKDLEQLYVRLMNCGSYSRLDVAVDMTDETGVARNLKFEALAAEISSRLAFFDSELMEAADEVLEAAIVLDPAYKTFFGDIRRRRRHKLEPETERILAALSPALELPYTAYEQSKHADMDFESFEADGAIHPLSYVLFENEYSLDPNATIRRAAFNAFSHTIRKYQNTVAALYNGEVQKQKIIAGLRGFDSVFDYLLDDQKVDRALYDRQIDTIMTGLAPAMRRYAKLLQAANGLERMTFADLRISLDPEYDPRVTIGESKRYISDALKILGDEYHELIMRAYSERWIDFAQNIGKSTGGFCDAPYGTHAYILLSWNGGLSEVFTLAHELGHAAHFMLASQNKSFFNCDPSLYFVESPSTCHELLLSHDLMQKNADPRFQRWVLSSMLQNTYYHNFVTHFLEAVYQREVYRRVDRGEPLQAADLSSIKRQVLEQFWGDAVEINEGAELTWMRQPHYYMGLYSYTYSAGLTIATEVSRRILSEGRPAVEDWLAALKAGGTVNPVEFAALAGVDLTTDAPLRHTIAYIGRIVDRIAELSR
ncbi:MAG: oligoendopeptidase F [Clostridiaceae bacterium]|nr:oligoendopeptidase F [Clostridiaceae bacterium]